MAIPLTLACGPYDRTLALALGDVRPAGIDLTYLRLQPHPEAIFWRMSRHQEFDAAEMSLSSYLLRRSRGDESLQAIPVFPSRFFRHGSIFVNAAAGIERPEDLKGKRVGVPEYQITAVEIRPIGEERTLSGMLAAGELDALMAAGPPSSFDGQRVRRLFPDFRAVEIEYFRRTGIFPIMHTVVIRRDVLERYPWAARNLYDGFCEAKRLAMSDL